jgi:predicted DsbA family dithiol-disulfide isomerase
MADPIEEEGAICGPTGCSPSPTTVAQPPSGIDSQRRHELTVVSDVICPWCFIGKRNLEKALELAGDNLYLKIISRPFELNPDMPKEGADRRVFRTKRFGSWEQSLRLDAQVREAGALAGLTFRHDLMQRTPNTFKAHRLIWLAEKEGVQDAVVESLFRAYFMLGLDVGDIQTLSEIAAQAGITEDRALVFLSSNEGTEEVRREEREAVATGISGVPTFILDGRPLFSGALKPSVMADQLLAAAALAHQ